MSARKKLRHALADALTGKTQAGSRIFHYRSLSFGTEELPAINILPVSTTTERIDNSTRELTLAVCGVLHAGSECQTVADSIDDFEAEILAVMECFRNPVCGVPQHIKTDIAMDESGQLPFASVRVFFKFVLRGDFYL